MCDPPYVNKKSEVICASPLYPSKQGKRGRYLTFDAIDITEHSEAFFNKKINYFDLQSKILDQILGDEKIRTLFMEGTIDDPILEALTLNNDSINESIKAYYLKLEALEDEGVPENMSDYVSAKAFSKISGTTTLTISLAVFGTFVALMLLIVFYKIERHLQSYTNSNKD